MKFYTVSDKDRKLTNINWSHINRYLSRWVGGTEFVIEIKRHEETESDPQRKWYYSSVLPKLSREVGYDPHEDSLVHDQLKARYFNIKPDKRGVLRGLPSVFSKKSTMTVKEKGEFIEWVLRIAAEYGVYIEEPKRG